LQLTAIASNEPARLGESDLQRESIPEQFDSACTDDLHKFDSLMSKMIQCRSGAFLTQGEYRPMTCFDGSIASLNDTNRRDCRQDLFQIRGVAAKARANGMCSWWTARDRMADLVRD